MKKQKPIKSFLSNTAILLLFLFSAIRRLKLSYLDSKISIFYSLVVKLSLLSFFVILTIYFVKEIAKDNYTVEMFDVPGSFDDDGVSGKVMVNKILDNMHKLKERAKTSKQMEGIEMFSEQMEQDIQVMEISLYAIKSMVRKTLNLESRSIKGEITIEGNKLKQVIRVSNEKPYVLEAKFTNGNYYEALDSIVNKSSLFLLKKNDPIILASYYFDNHQYKKCIEIVEYTVKHKPDNAKWAYNFWGVSLSHLEYIKKAVLNYKKAFVTIHFLLFD